MTTRDHTVVQPALPRVLAELVSLIGFAQTLAIVAARGGEEVYLPPTRLLAGKHKNTHWLVKAIGLDAAIVVCEHFRGAHISKIVIPMGAASMQRASIDHGIESGLSNNAIARTAKVHERTARRHRSRYRQEHPSFKLSLNPQRGLT